MAPALNHLKSEKASLAPVAPGRAAPASVPVANAQASEPGSCIRWWSLRPINQWMRRISLAVLPARVASLSTSARRRRRLYITIFPVRVELLHGLPEFEVLA